MAKVTPYERLLALTLSLEQALEGEQWEMAGSLLNERDNIIDALPAGSTSPLTAKIEAAQERCRRLIQTRKSEIAKTMADAINSRRMRATYGSDSLQASGLGAEF